MRRLVWLLLIIPTILPMVARADDAADIIARCGTPSLDDSTQYDRPRPPIITRWLEYRRAKVNVVFVPDAPATAAPPYTGWKVVGYVDKASNTAISRTEALRRIGCR